MGYAVLDFNVGWVGVQKKGVVIVQDDCINTEYGLLRMKVVVDCWEGIFQGRHPGVTAFKSVFPPSAENAWDAAFAGCQRMNTLEAEVGLQGVAKFQR